MVPRPLLFVGTPYISLLRLSVSKVLTNTSAHSHPAMHFHTCGYARLLIRTRTYSHILIPIHTRTQSYIHNLILLYTHTHTHSYIHNLILLLLHKTVRSNLRSFSSGYDFSADLWAYGILLYELYEVVNKEAPNSCYLFIYLNLDV